MKKSEEGRNPSFRNLVTFAIRDGKWKLNMLARCVQAGVPWNLDFSTKKLVEAVFEQNGEGPGEPPTFILNTLIVREKD